VPFFVFNFHNSPFLTLADIFKQFSYTTIGYLNVYPRHAYGVKILDFIVGFFHKFNDTEATTIIKQFLRQKHKSNAVIFHITKGGAVPTLTHQMITGR